MKVNFLITLLLISLFILLTRKRQSVILWTRVKRLTRPVFGDAIMLLSGWNFAFISIYTYLFWDMTEISSCALRSPNWRKCLKLSFPRTEPNDAVVLNHRRIDRDCYQHDASAYSVPLSTKFKWSLLLNLSKLNIKRFGFY